MGPHVVVSLIRDTESAKCDVNGWKKKKNMFFATLYYKVKKKKNVSKEERPNLY